MKIKLFILVLLLLVAGAGFYFVPKYIQARKAEASVAAEPLPPVFVTTASEGTVYDSVDAIGTAFSNESVNISSNVTEVLREVLFVDGQEVVKDDILVVLEQREQQAQLDAARARMEQDKRELARLEGLLAEKAVPRQDYDTRLTMLEVTKQEMAEAEARVAFRTIRAPFDGVLGVRLISPGALVQPGDLITTLDDISPIKLDFTVPSTYLSALKPGVEIEAIADALDNRVFRGRIESVNTRVDPVTRSVLVRAILPNDDHILKPGLLLKVTLIKNERTSVILPEETLMQRQEDHFVLVVADDNKVEQRKVSVGARRPGKVEITAGLKTGERVIVRGVNRVRAGQLVEVTETWPPLDGWDAEVK
ncbi:MAG TPA: efflux RND transporter periplasmic adaptor subunit [Alphaproteobacteria bacterium]|nr:efflux RND transporter periplasmic adaptor subunit [Alphaproteobacteria bacterium]